MSIERVVTILTPLFGAASAWITGVITSNVPGLPPIPAADITALQVAGFTGAVAAAVHWLHGRQKFVQFTGDVDHVISQVVAKVKADQPAAVALDDLEDVLKAHTGAIVDAIGKATHAPPSVDDILKQVVQRITAPGSAAVPLAPAPAPAAPAAAPQATGGAPTA